MAKVMKMLTAYKTTTGAARPQASLLRVAGEAPPSRRAQYYPGVLGRAPAATPPYLLRLRPSGAFGLAPRAGLPVANPRRGPNMSRRSAPRRATNCGSCSLDQGRIRTSPLAAGDQRRKALLEER